MRHKETAGRKTSKKACLHLTGTYTHTHTHTHLGQIAPGTRRWCRCCRSRWIGQTQTLPPPLRSFLSVEPDADTMAVAPGTKHNTHTETHTQLQMAKLYHYNHFLSIARSLAMTRMKCHLNHLPTHTQTHSLRVYLQTHSHGSFGHTYKHPHVYMCTHSHTHEQP